MNAVLGHGSALLGCIGPGKISANEMKYVMSHVPGAGSIAQL